MIYYEKNFDNFSADLGKREIDLFLLSFYITLQLHPTLTVYGYWCRSAAEAFGCFRQPSDVRWASVCDKIELVLYCILQHKHQKYSELLLLRLAMPNNRHYRIYVVSYNSAAVTYFQIEYKRKQEHQPSRWPTRYAPAFAAYFYVFDLL